MLWWSSQDPHHSETIAASLAQPMRPFGRRGCDASQKVDPVRGCVYGGERGAAQGSKWPHAWSSRLQRESQKTTEKMVFPPLHQRKNKNKKRIGEKKLHSPQFHQPPRQPPLSLFLFLHGLHGLPSIAVALRLPNGPLSSPSMMTPLEARNLCGKRQESILCLATRETQRVCWAKTFHALRLVTGRHHSGHQAVVRLSHCNFFSFLFAPRRLCRAVQTSARDWAVFR